MLALRLREADEVLAATSFMTVKGRLARAFLELAEHLGQKDNAGHVTIGHKISQRELAAIAGIARENVSRTLATWKRRKLVALSTGYYRILSMKAMKDEMDDL
jgi:CRP-like cAMP-binding protein